MEDYIFSWIVYLSAGTPYLAEILTLLTAAHALALAIVNLTPAPDRKVYAGWVARLYHFVEIAAGIVHAKNVKS
jgi:hypothetical protein